MVEIPSSNDEKENAAADWLTDKDSGAAAKTPSPAPSPVASDESYDVMGGGASDDEGDPASFVPQSPIPVTSRERKPRKPALEPEEEEGRSRRSRPKRGTVDEVWTRWAECGSDVIRVVLAAVVLLIPLYFAVVALQFVLAFLILVAGAVVIGVLGYPIFVTMERPVRITPEQALKDYYSALSHQVPHIRRMWLLLSSAGRKSPYFSSFGEFKTYWDQKLTAMKGTKGGRLNPLVFTIRDFKSEKSAGLTELDAKFTLNVRSSAEEGSTGQNYHGSMGLVKGPDKMWYLEDGTMPGA